MAGKEAAELPAGLITPIKDTYAYTLLTIESLKKKPDPKVLKEMARELKGVVLSLQAGSGPKKREDYAALSIARTHYLSARELAGE